MTESELAKLRADIKQFHARRQRQLTRVKEILKQHGMELSVGGCGCCRSPWVTFIYRGETILDNEQDFSFDTREDEVER